MHIAADCPNQRIIAPVEGDIENEAIEDEATSGDHEEVGYAADVRTISMPKLKYST